MYLALLAHFFRDDPDEADLSVFVLVKTVRSLTTLESWVLILLAEFTAVCDRLICCGMGWMAACLMPLTAFLISELDKFGEPARNANTIVCALLASARIVRAPRAIAPAVSIFNS